MQSARKKLLNKIDGYHENKLLNYGFSEDQTKRIFKARDIGVEISEELIQDLKSICGLDPIVAIMEILDSELVAYDNRLRARKTS